MDTTYSFYGSSVDQFLSFMDATIFLWSLWVQHTGIFVHFGYKFSSFITSSSLSVSFLDIYSFFCFLINRICSSLSLLQRKYLDVCVLCKHDGIYKFLGVDYAYKLLNINSKSKFYFRCLIHHPIINVRLYLKHLMIHSSFS